MVARSRNGLIPRSSIPERAGWPLDAGADIFTRLSYHPQDRLVDIKDVTVILGHSSVTVSLERYSHLFEAGKAQSAAQINAWFEAADSQRRVAQLQTA